MLSLMDMTARCIMRTVDLVFTRGVRGKFGGRNLRLATSSLVYMPRATRLVIVAQDFPGADVTLTTDAIAPLMAYTF